MWKIVVGRYYFCVLPLLLFKVLRLIICAWLSIKQAGEKIPNQYNGIKGSPHQYISRSIASGYDGSSNVKCDLEKPFKQQRENKPVLSVPTALFHLNKKGLSFSPRALSRNRKPHFQLFPWQQNIVLT